MNTSAKPLQSKQKQNDPKQEETETKEGEDKSDKQSCPHVLECLEYFEGGVFRNLLFNNSYNKPQYNLFDFMYMHLLYVLLHLLVWSFII